MTRSKYEQGLKVEREHKKTYEWLVDYINKYKKAPDSNEFFLHIADDHLREDADYYDKLKQLGL